MSPPGSPGTSKTAPTSPTHNSSDPRSTHSSPAPPPTKPLPLPPTRERAPKLRSKSSSPPARKTRSRAPGIPETKFPPPVPPRKSFNRVSQLPSPVSVSHRRFSDEISPRTVPHSPIRANRPASPLPPPLSPRHKSTNITDKELPVMPFRRVKFETSTSEPSTRCNTPVQETKPAIPQRSPLRNSIYEIKEAEMTRPLNPKRASLRRSVSFRFGEGLHRSRLSRTSTMLCNELSDALVELQRAIGAAAIEVH